MVKRKWTNNGLQCATQKTKYRATQTPLKTLRSYSSKCTACVVSSCHHTFSLVSKLTNPMSAKKTLQETKGAITNEQYIDTRHKTNTTQKTKKTNNTDPTKIGGEPTC